MLADTDRILSGTFTDDDGVLTNEPSSNILFKIYQDGDIDPKANIVITSGDLTILNNGTVNFRVALPNAYDLPDGIYSVEIEVSDNLAAKNVLKPASLSNLSATTHNTNDEDNRRIYFVLDTDPPVLTETIILSTDDVPCLKNGLFSLGGDVSDINGLRSLRIIQSEAGIGSVKTIFNAEYNGTKTAAWSLLSLPLAADFDSPDLRDGTFTYEITAMDVVQRTTKLTRRIVVDTIPPVLSITHPAQGAWVNGSVAVVRGTETDNYRTGPVFYSIKSAPSMGASAPDEFTGKTTPEDYRWDSAWKELPVLGAEWSDNILLGTGGLEEGTYFLYVAAFDAAGNLTTNSGSVRTFGVN
jgi:hypothetical protein